jgi:hypothetical protein
VKRGQVAVSRSVTPTPHTRAQIRSEGGHEFERTQVRSVRCEDPFRMIENAMHPHTELEEHGEGARQVLRDEEAAHDPRDPSRLVSTKDRRVPRIGGIDEVALLEGSRVPRDGEGPKHGLQAA